MAQEFMYVQQLPDEPVSNSGASELARRRVGISAAALLLGGGTALGLIPRAGQFPPETTVSDNAGSVAQLPPNAAVATRVNDRLPFNEAFAAARAEVGPGGVFVWHGQPYNTFWQEEWAELSLAQRQEYAEMVLNAELPVQQMAQPHTDGSSELVTNVPGQPGGSLGKPTVIEGYVGGQRVMGVDDDNDGIIDALVIAAGDGVTYKVVDRTGDDGLDTLYQYDTVAGDYQLLHALPLPTLLTNSQLNQNLEEAMSRQVVDDILADDRFPPSAYLQSVVHVEAAHWEDDGADSYINNGDVHDMDDPEAEYGSE